MKYNFFTFLFLTLSIFSCNSDKVVKIIVASEKGDCVGVAPQKCLLIKTDKQREWEFLYNNIEGFEYEPGYEYTLKIRKEPVVNPAQDQSSIRYILVKEISKEKKDSEI